ncbi:uncharacterized protein PHACADRAFT_198742 [Phanerochaete carnosa HHB-10118-sp]|uniref:Uncharacterized protein n=1 Tax=Phanerochaete carnosa (strain HHB-10118-sp) TaxID=650164 RepID=K5W1C2_PHACS|nr:uncharacterized protein PHACADRAFT_198742 [Phanerochaete carnosa HHB-10118-sp]EKM52699.1 hypothetical protein PHACADRAFT_198742 [Phanerochaete carnosa HHB-10118-sp]
MAVMAAGTGSRALAVREPEYEHLYAASILPYSYNIMVGVPVPPAGKVLLGESVEESRVKRLEKQQSRYRDRGGMFVPADTNPLLDVLLARGVNGESPQKQRSMAPSPSPPRKARKSAVSVVRAKKPKAKASDGGASPAKVARRKSARVKRDPKPKSRAAVKSVKKTANPGLGVQDNGAPTAGPSKLPPEPPSGARMGKARLKASGM